MRKVNKNLKSLERIELTLEFKEPDRVPIDFGSRETTIHEEAYLRLRRYLGINDRGITYKQFFLKSIEVDRKVLDFFGSDIVNFEIGMEKISNTKLKIDFDKSTFENEWGTKYKISENKNFFHYYDFPLKTLGKSEIKSLNWPEVADRTRAFKSMLSDEFNKKEKAILLSGITGIVAVHWFLRGLEQSYMDLALQPEETSYLLDMILEWQINIWDNILNEVGDKIHVIEAINDDVASEEGLIISPEIYRKIIKPRQKKLISFLKTRTKAKIFAHSCGAVREIIPDFIEIGIDILNPVQISARGMDSSQLKKEFGKDIVFCGGGCSNNILQQGNIKSVKEEVKKRLDDFMPEGGYIFAPIHNIQPGVPVENIIALFEEVKRYGVYKQ